MRILKIFFVGVYVLSTLASSFKAFASSANLEVSDLDLSIGESAKKTIWIESQDIMRKFLNSSVVSSNDINLDELSIMDTQPKLLIFVSTSMSETLLRNYYKEASKVGGTLVFKGLPNGSFKDLVGLITRLNEGQNGTQEEVVAGSIIDDESFSKFGVISVPTIVLAEEWVCFEEESCKRKYDKISGNIGIRGALERFASSGDMGIIAQNILAKMGW